MEQRAELRLLLNQVLRTDADFEAFCHDHFHDVFRRFSAGMDRVQKTTLLLTIADHGQLTKLLSELLPTSSPNGMASQGCSPSSAHPPPTSAASHISFPFRRSMPFIGLALAILFIAIYRIIALNNPSSATPTSSFDTIRPDLASFPASSKVLLYIDSNPSNAKVYRHASWGYDLLGPTPIRGYALIRPRSGKVELKLVAAGRPDYNVVIDIPLSDKEIRRTLDLE